MVARDRGRWIAAAGLVGASAAVVLWVRLLPLSLEAVPPDARDLFRHRGADGREHVYLGMREEHFGMGPAELVRAGALVWLARGGGQVEIVGDEPSLLYDTEDEAAEKIAAVLGNPAEERRLREHLHVRAERFAPGRFVDEVRQIVATFEA